MREATTEGAAKLRIRQFSGRVGDRPLTLAQISEISGALATLQRLGEEGLIDFEINEPDREGRRQPRADARDPAQRKLQPQHREVLKAMQGDEWLSAEAISSRSDVPRNSIRPRLLDLIEMGHIEKRQESRLEGRPINLYRLTRKDAT